MAEEKPPTPAERLAASEAKREARKAKLKDGEDAQRALDTEAISEIEERLGDSRVKVVNVPYNPGHVVKVAIRCPEHAEIKKYRYQVKPRKDGKQPDVALAHEEIGEACLVYPSEDKFSALCDLLPGLKGQLGIHAVALSVGEEEAAGKD